jgi:23S rRNA pseudouridine2605 synthase
VTVDGRAARLGERAGAGSAIALDGKPLRLAAAPAAPRVLLYHKPVGEIVSRRDPAGRPTVFARLPKLRSGRWVAIGRLDLNSAGLLLFTDSGELAARLMHPRHGVEREDAVRVRGELPERERRRLLAGVELEDGSARLERIEPMDRGRSGAANRWYRAVLSEGRKREVRRIFEAIGHPVSRLIRVRFGPLRLPRELRPGRWIELDAAQVQSLAEAPQASRDRPRP